MVGVEFSEIAVNEFFNENKINANVYDSAHFKQFKSDGITIFQGDYYQLNPEKLPKFDFIYDRAALVAMPKDRRDAYVNHLLEFLSADTRLLLVSLDYQQHEMAGPPFAVSEQQVQSLFSNQCSIQPLDRTDQLANNAHLKQKGLSGLTETVYLIQRHPDNAGR